jgi:transcriptional regulator with XRE-family HTH domain
MAVRSSFKDDREFTAAMKQKMAARIKYIRKKLGYDNYEQFANAHNFARTQYGRYEKGEDLRFSTLTRILWAFGMTLTEFFSEGFESESSAKTE